MSATPATPTAPTCALGLTPDDLSAWRDHALDSAGERRITAHVAGCAACQRTIAMHEALAAGLRAEREPLPDSRNWSQVRGRIAARRARARTPRPTRSAIWSGAGAVAAAAILVALFASAFGDFGIDRPSRATATSGPLRSAIASQPRDTTLPLVPYGYLGSVSFSSAQDGWVVGGVTLFEPAPQQGVLIHYSNGVWERSPDAFPNLTVLSVSMVSASDGWAVARAQSAQANQNAGPVLLHFTGDANGQGHWRVANVPTLVGFIPTEIRMFSSDSGYIAGSYLAPDPANGPKAENAYMAVGIYQHGSWLLMKTQFPLDSGSAANAITMVSPTEGWASVRSSVTSPNGAAIPQTTIYHFANGAWNETMSDQRGAVTSLTAGSPGDVWAMLQECPNCVAPYPSILHDTGAGWNQVDGPSPRTLKLPGSYHLATQMIFATADGGDWLSYVWQDAASTAMLTTTWRFVNNGWQLVGPNVAEQIVALTEDHQGGVWAIADSVSNPVTTTVLYTHGDGWKIYGRS